MNSAFLQKYNPFFVTIIGLGLWVMVFLLTPSVIKVEITGGLFLIGLNFSFFLFGIWFYKFLKDSVKEKKDIGVKAFKLSRRNNYRFFYISFVLGTLSALLRLYERFFVRGISLSSSVLENRDSFASEGGTLLGVIVSMMTGAVILPLFLKEFYRLRLNLAFRVANYAIFFSPVLELIAGGSRSFLLVLIFMLLYIRIISGKLQVTFKGLAKIFFIGNFFIVASGYMFIERSKEFAGDKVIEYLISGDAVFMYTTEPPKETIKNILAEENEFVQALKTTYLTTGFYYTHAVFEYMYLVENFKNRPFFYGGYTFFVIPKMISKLGFFYFGMDELEEATPRAGVYTTFFGPIFVDFGWLSPVFMLCFGFLIARLHHFAKNGSPIAILTYGFMIQLILFMPVFNFIIGAGGSYMLFSFLFSYGIYKLLFVKLLR